jgi:NADH-quinone oxidoreductase subunit L
MGGLLKKMPITGFTFLIGTAALMAVPFVTSGFYSKEEILAAAFGRNKALFGIAVFVAFLTTFYMTRAFVVTFLGKARSKNADHAHEVGPIMFVPLALLAVLAIAAGFEPVSHALGALRPEHAHGHAEGHTLILGASIGSLVLGLIAGIALYRGKDKDPVSIPAFRERLYFDHFYDNIVVRYFQNAFAALVHLLDEFLINGLIVGGLSRLAESFGGLFRRVQSGNLQGYAFAFGIGVILVIYFTAF